MKGPPPPMARNQGRKGPPAPPKPSRRPPLAIPKINIE